MAHPTQARPTLTLGALREALRAAFPGAVLVATWVLREVIVHDRPGGSGLFVPRRRTHGIERARAEALASQERLPIDGIPPDQDWLALLPEPESDWLASTAAPLALRHYWRLLFRARVSAGMRGQLGSPGVTAPESSGVSLLRRLDPLGRAGLHEIRQVLHEERLLPGGAGDSEVCAEFAAVFLEMFYFDRPVLRRFFPMMPGAAPVLEWIGQTIDAESLWRHTRLAGAADPPGTEPADAGNDAAAEPVPAGPADEPEPAEHGPGGSESRRQQDALFAAADRAAARGNDVRAAVLHTQAFQFGGTRAGVNFAGRDMDALAERLASVREIGGATAAEWRQLLRTLLAPVARGWWNHQARLLYDLQKVCINNEREVYSVNLVEWALDSGRRPLRRPLPRQRLVLMVKHLHSAQSRLTRMHLGAAVRPKLTEALRTAAHAAESSLHEQLYPVVLSALQASGLGPGCHAEVVARNKLVEELLDTVVRKGFLSLGDLRDAISRNAMKLDDLRGPGEFIRGDQLLRIDRKLSIELDGVYRRGEIYRRGFQRVSSLLYADRIGRLLTRTLFIPLGGAYLVLEGIEHTVGLLINLIFGVHAGLGVGIHGLPAHEEPLRGWKVPGLNVWVDHPFRYLAVVALFFLLANWPAFRAAAGHSLRRTGRVLHWLFVDFPGWFLNRPIVRALVRSPALRLGVRYLVKPLALAGLAWLILPGGLGVVQRALLGGGAFIAANLMLNSRRVRALEGLLLHRLRIGWEKLTGNILTGLYHMVRGFFEVVLEDVDRMLYQVDEWLRFRSGQSKAALVAKALLGVCWFYAAYLVRFVINLLIEPQLNPIKHFPVVTVAAKLILPQVKRIDDALVAHGLGHGKARLITASIAIGVPGMCGFLAWELLSNWKLYKANRPPALGPVPVGSHGESVARLLRPGIHSGTIPKIFARLRRAAAGRRSGRRMQKHLHALEHVREAVEHFLERELIARLSRHPAWAGTPIELGEVTLTPSSIVAELHRPTPGRPGPATQHDSEDGRCEGVDGFAKLTTGNLTAAKPTAAKLGAGPMRISFRNWSGWIVAGIDEMGWAAAPNADVRAYPCIAAPCPQEAALLSLALAGLYKLAGVDLVREQVDSVLAAAFGLDADSRSLRWDVRHDELLVWLDGRQKAVAAYSLADGALRPTMLTPQKIDDDAELAGSRAPPSVDSGKLMLRHVPIAWEAWSNAWEPAAGPAARAAALNGIRVLPEVPLPDLAPVETM
jgi:hypothetical protein